MIEETNYAQILLDNGFKPTLYDKKLGYNPNDNFFGVSTYHPYVILIKNDKEVIISLQGMIGSLYFKDNEINNEVSKQRKLKFIIFINKGEIIYKNSSGVFPDREFIRNFCGD